MDAKKLYHLDSNMYEEKDIPKHDIERFYNKTLANLNFGTEEEETIMDIGCGPGRLTAKVIPLLFPNLKKIYGVDLLPNMIEYAKTHNSHPKIEYSVASIEDWSAVEHLKGKMSTIISFHCFNWLKNQRQSFENVYKLLQFGGQAAFFFTVHAPYLQAIEDIAKDPKWRDFCKGVETYTPESHFKKYGVAYYKEMMEDIGFSIVEIKMEMYPVPFPTDEIFRNFFASLCVLVPHIPADRREEFKDDLFQYNIKLNGRNEAGLPVNLGTTIEIVVKKK